MTLFHRRPALRWVVPLLAVVLLAGGGSAVGVITAAARGDLPQRSASQLLVDVQRARLDGLSGTVVQNADLGLPALPGVGGTGSSDLTSLVSGSHTLRLWYADPNHVRLALLGSLGESDLVRNGTDVWHWSSTDRSATHRTVPLSRDPGPASLASGSPMTPQQVADQVLAAVTPSTRVTTDETTAVAGRPAYELRLVPRDSGSLVGSVRIAIDGETHVPTRVQVYADGATDPAFEVGFTSFDPSDPPASVFRFDPPPGTKVTESSDGGPGGWHAGSPDHSRGGGHSGDSTESQSGEDRADGSTSSVAPSVVGTGWTTVLVAHLPAEGLPGAGGRLLQTLPRIGGDWGSGRLLRGSLFSAVLTDDGRVALGAVPPERLSAALSAR